MASSPTTTVERVLDEQGRRLIWLARKAKVSASYASLMLAGKRPLTPEFKAAAAEALGVPEDLLFPVEPERAAS